MGRVYIYVTRGDYGAQLAWYIARRHTSEVTAELLTEGREDMVFDRQDYLVTDSPEMADRTDCHVVKLVSVPEEAGENAIFIYQKKEKVYQQLLRILGTRPDIQNEEKPAEGTKLIAVLSPEGSDAGTVLALETAGRLAGEEAVLYVSLCGFPVLSGKEFLPEDRKGGGLSEIMLQEGGSGFAGRLRELAFPVEQIWVLLPVGCYKDLLDFSRADVENFLKGLKKQKEFGAVVLEMGQMFEYTFDVLAQADQIYVPREDGFFAAVKRHVLRQYCVMEGREEIWSRIRFEETAHSLPVNEKEVRNLIRTESGRDWDEQQ